MKKFMQKINYKVTIVIISCQYAMLLKCCMKILKTQVTTSALKERFSKYDKHGSGEIGFDDFCSILQV